MFEDYYLNEDGEKVYYHEEHGMRFEWMKAEDIECVRKSKSTRSISPQTRYNSCIVNGYNIIGFAIKNSNEWNGNLTDCLIIHDNILYIRRLSHLLNRGWTPFTAFNSINYKYYLYNRQTKHKHIIEGYVNEFKNAFETKLKLYNPSCGHRWETTSICNYGKSGCPFCWQYTKENYIKKIYSIRNPSETNIEVIGYKDEFNYIQTKLILKHNICGHIWDTTSIESYIYNNISCLKCNQRESKNLIDIDNIIVEFTREQKFAECYNIFELPFDRYIEDKNILIEYDGEQHFKFIKHWHKNINGFKRTQLRDKIKTAYAINNGFNFLRIAYYEDHVAVLKDFLKLVEDNPNKQVVQIYGSVQIINKQDKAA